MYLYQKVKFSRFRQFSIIATTVTLPKLHSGGLRLSVEVALSEKSREFNQLIQNDFMLVRLSVRLSVRGVLGLIDFMSGTGA